MPDFQEAIVHDPSDKISDPEFALHLLKEGNKRYLSNEDQNTELRTLTKDAQNPFALILTCSDSRVVPEIIFNKRLGDLFVIRTAGHIVDVSVLASVEYAVSQFNIPLIMVMGHSNCGAVTEAMKGGQYSENLRLVIDAIKPVVESSSYAEDAICANIRCVAAMIKDNAVVKESGAMVVGSYYCLETGTVSILP